MSKLCMSLPPFAPDYSGAASALFDMGGMIVVHDASGCTGNYTGYDEPRWYDANTAVFCSGLRHMDAVLGNDEKLINKVMDAAKELNPRFIAVVGSPVPMVIGTDFKGIASEIEFETGIPSIGLATRGLGYYGTGIAEATIEMLKKFAKKKKEKIPGTINLLGITPLDFFTNSNAEDFRKLYEDNGIRVLASYSMGMRIEDMQESVAAQLNVAVSQAGVQIAEYMKCKYDIPYVVTTPFGDGDIALQKVKNALAGTEEDFVSESKEAKIVVVGEQVIGNSIRENLQTKYGVGAICVASLFDTTREIQAEGDLIIRNESQLRTLIKSGDFTTVIGDPMVKKLLPTSDEYDIHFYSLPHVAISSKVHWDEYKRFVCKETENWLNSIASFRN